MRRYFAVDLRHVCVSVCVAFSRCTILFQSPSYLTQRGEAKQVPAEESHYDYQPPARLPASEDRVNGSDRGKWEGKRGEGERKREEGGGGRQRQKAPVRARWVLQGRGRYFSLILPF